MNIVNENVLANNTGYRGALKRAYELRTAKNPHYSQRAFARDIAIKPNCLSEIFRGKRGLSAKKAQEIARRLGYTQEVADLFCDMVRAEHGRSMSEKDAARKRLIESKKEIEYKQLELDSFKLISEWFHLAIIELTKIKDFVASLPWVAKALSIPLGRASEAVARLEKLGFLERNKDRWIPKSPNNFLPGGVPAECVRKTHEGLLRKAISALNEQSVDQRENFSLMVALNAQRLPEVKSRIKEFWTQLDKDLGQDAEKTDVYCLGIQFFSLTEGKNRE